MARSSFIPAESIAACARWQFGSVDPGGDPQGGIVDPQALRDAHEEGRAIGIAQGRAEAMAEARLRMDDYIATQGRETAARLAALVAGAEAGLAEAQQDIARGTLEIACAIARQVLRRELASRPESIEPVVREALVLLMADGRSATVRLAPVDFDLLQAPLAAELAGQPVQLVADGAVAPGDCLIESAGAVVDGGVAARWSRAVASLGLQQPWDEAREAADAA